jgi:regulator of sirC expression with transglutaminase-like and TPR domain
LSALARAIHVPRWCDPPDHLARVAHHLFAEQGFRGDDDDDAQNSMIDRVLERRRGLPILLSIALIEVAGLALAGAGFPGPHHLAHAPTAPAVGRVAIQLSLLLA